MNWKYAKTLFIFVFLIINISLAIMYVNKINKSHINDVEDTNEVDFKQEEIKIPKELPDARGIKAQLITGRSKDFKDYAKSKSDVKSEDGGKVAAGTISPAISVSKDQVTALKSYMKNNVYKGEYYQLYNTDDNEAVFEQTYHGLPIMNNDKAKLKFKINDNEEASSYHQRAIAEIGPSKGENNREKQVVSARKAIEALYYNRYLKRNDAVTSVRLGYYSVVRETNVQVFQANWEIKVNHSDKKGDKTYYVEATSKNPKIIVR
ncbi:yycH family protein [Staphylococcus piscifermentans]|uniref:Regulatory protein YycH-like domain-containing protein n=1 Tax=Staphylococcus piscifermentans TaxID=70258 RepID=A0A239TDG5_9STAP|nr:two-component system regulatory protein YycI [Staphylococcus piscifermentans]RTX83341.1 hypothetical protein CD139_09405 [Staphylococcus piscifermentans]GEP85072.1 hypothetical protein SPI02_16570 [Staphylococcus piscifermentans]SNU95579.1 yycH family protein [Staphylococcus piscifermentans]